MTRPQKKRFYDEADVSSEAGMFVVRLDGRVPKTPEGARLELPNADIAALVAGEWRAQTENIDFISMPVTQLAFAAIDRVAHHRQEIVDETAAYGATDLVCFLADQPQEFVELQLKAWKPLHDWFAEKFQAPLQIGQGIIAAPQSAQALEAISRAVADHDDFLLAALNGATRTTGSVIISLAVSDGFIDAERAWDVCRIDEEWQISRWGRDDQADRLAETRKRDLLAQAQILRTLSK